MAGSLHSTTLASNSLINISIVAWRIRTLYPVAQAQPWCPSPGGVFLTGYKLPVSLAFFHNVRPDAFAMPELAVSMDGIPKSQLWKGSRAIGDVGQIARCLLDALG
jgi:hypothetical protein